MDTSETYIKMRLAARKHLLDGTLPEFIGWNECNWVTANVFVDTKGDFYFATESDQCQLERQDQLQEMVSEHFKAGLDLCNLYTWYIRNRPHDAGQEWNSMEQLWLAFVMKEKYNKVWNGEEWVKAE